MWNCSGLRSTSSASEKIEFVEVNTPFDILILVETHHKNFSDISTLFHTYTNTHHIFQTEAPENDPYAGIVILASKALVAVTPSELVAGRLFNLKFRDGSRPFNLSAIYGYTGTNATLSKMENMIDILAETHRVSDNNIVLGDFNFVDSDLDRTNRNHSGMNQRDGSFSRLWTRFIDEMDLTDPFRARNPKRRMFSYIHTQNNAKSRIDRVYTNDENCSDVLHYKHTLTGQWPMAHRIVSFTLDKNVERGPGFWKLNTSVLPDRAYELIVDSTVKDVLALNIPDAIERWLVFIETIRLESQIYCSKKRFLEREVKNQCERHIELLERNPLLEKNTDLQIQHQYYTNRLKDWTRKQIEGHQIRIKTQPKFEYCEPKIDFYANLEKKAAKKKIITHLKNDNGEVFQDTEGLKTTVTDYYTNLFSPKPTNSNLADKLLRNVVKTVSPENKEKLNSLITKEELELAVMKLRRNKSPGPDGIPAEFYQYFWHLIQDLYFDFISAVDKSVFPIGKNTSVTSLIFKNKGDIDLLAYYRPIALMNVDVKILTKLLSRRLVPVLPTIIHASQTAVFGRNIGDNIHLVRDIIDLANKNDEEAALLFLDQEKAFDRVNHDFLYKVLNRFGLGDYFIHWIKLLYFNASTRININGHLTGKIPLKCGVRQGCPLSALLYVMVIEILALQLRANPNIVGFVVQGEKLVSSHYADDTVIKITQNRCFKEVYKDLREYEMASGARVNYEKTQGLWLGKWKNRKDDPFKDCYENSAINIKWTNKNVKYLGIFVGNDDPDKQTFSEIIPRMQRRLHFWKPLQLPILAKARVIEIFHASKLFYASNFYPIPTEMVKDVEHAFIDYVNFPSKKKMVSKLEMEKLREFGGIKLINMKLKAETPKIKWLMRLLTDDNLHAHRIIFESLIALEGLHLSGCEIIFAESSFIRRSKISNPFYNEALLGISKLNTYKQFPDINQEHLFYNKIFVTSTDDDVHDKTLTPFRGNAFLGTIRTYGDLLQAENTAPTPKLASAIRRKREMIEYIRESVETHLVVGHDQKEYSFDTMTQKQIYAELIQEQSRDHAYVGRWSSDRFGLIDWDVVWTSLHNQFFTETTKSAIWKQIHLNFLTTHNFNVWFNMLNPCPLCRKIPEDVFHIVIDCKFTKVMWRRLEKSLIRITPKPLTVHEMAFGLKEPKQEKYPVILRNWITFTLRQLIMLEERKVYKMNIDSDDIVTPSPEKFWAKFNFEATLELKYKKLLYDFQGLSEKFKAIVTVNGAIATVVNGEFHWQDIL